MAENKKGFMLYADLIHTVSKMPDDKAGQLLKTILEYVNDKNPKVDDLLIDLVFEPIKQQLKRDLIKWEERAEKSRKNGSKGGRPRKNLDNLDKPTETHQVILKPKKPDIVNVTDNVTDTVRVIIPDEIIYAYKTRISDLQGKVKETKSVNEMVLNHKNYFQEILTGIENYSKTIKDLEDKYITNLLDFLVNKVYMDYQDTKPIKVELDYKGEPLKGNYDG